MQAVEFMSRRGAILGKVGVLYVALLLAALPLLSQKVVVLTAADVGKVITGTHHYSPKDQTFKLAIKHRLGDQRTWTLSLQKEQQFEKGPFSLKSTLPATLPPDGVLELEFGVNYAKSLQQDNTISLLAAPQGEADLVGKGIAINMKVTAQGELMFFTDRTKAYTKTIPTFEFVGASDRLVEVTWNGGGSTTCTIKIEDNGRDAFKLIPNMAGATAVPNGQKFPLSGGGAAFFIRYDGAAPKGSADVARITFTESGGQSIVVSMIGTYQGGTSLFAAARDLLTKDNLMGGYKEPAVVAITPTKSSIKEGANGNDPNPTKSSIKDAAKPDGKDAIKSNPPTKDNPDVAATTNPPVKANPPAVSVAPSPKAAPVSFTEGDGMITRAIAEERLLRYYNRYGQDNLIKVGSARFDKQDGKYLANIRIQQDDSLKADPAFTLHFIKAKFKAGSDSVTINAGDNAKIFGDTTLQLALSPDDQGAIIDADSFQITAEFLPEYESDEGMASNDSLIFKGYTYGKTYSSNNWRYFLWGGVIALVVLFFVIGFLVSRKAVNSLRYLRESRYQRERHTANTNRQRVDVETIHIDLARRDTDLIQLAFNGRGEVLDDRAKPGDKVRAVAATLPAPVRGGLARFFIWLYGPFGRKKEAKFKAVYYSLRVELPRGSVPQQMRLKDDSGLLMLGTTLTGNVLATDHQDFKFIKRPFHYSLYLDPAEILDYAGSMKTVSIPFRVIEEPFEGYVMTREFNLNLEIAQRF